MADEKPVTEKTVLESVHNEVVRDLEQIADGYKRECIGLRRELVAAYDAVNRAAKETSLVTQDMVTMCAFAARLVKIVPPDNPLYGELKTMFAKYGVTF